MRIWSLHPKYLDAKGIVALWREALLAQNVLAGKTKGYKNHPQLHRFIQARDPLATISTYLWGVYEDSLERSYNFDKTKIAKLKSRQRIQVTQGQVEYEMEHLIRKLKPRDNPAFEIICGIQIPEVHPMFDVIDGGVEGWERVG